jgi:hypothetical protein
MLHRIRSVLVRPGRERLRDEIEVDETTFGGEEAGLPGGRARGEKRVLVGVAVERTQPRGFGRCRIAPLPDASADSLRAFLTANVEPGAGVVTTAGSRTARRPKVSTSTNASPAPRGRRPTSCSPACTRFPRSPKRWLLGTHQGSVDAAHLPGYLNEFVPRFNRRRSRSRGLVFYRVVELAVAHDPVRYRDLVVDPRPSGKPRQPPGSRGRPPSMGRPPADRPWRAEEMIGSG